MADTRSESTTDPTGEGGPPDAQSPKSKLRSRFFYLAYLVFAVSGILLVAELCLAGLHWMTQNPRFATLKEKNYYGRRLYPEYPQNPDEYVKIAVFGGSAAAGAFSPRAFHEVVEYELKQRYPGKKIFVKNHAKSGYPFHRHQAEFVKLLIDKYDFFLIYCGNNEGENWFDDSGYWRHPQYKDAKELVFQRPLEADPRLLEQLLRTLETHSRIYALVKGGQQQIGEVISPVEKNIARNYQEFEAADALPPAERKNIVTNFENDLVQIAQLAEERDKQVLVSVTATYETWPPCYSFFRSDITAGEKGRWHEHFSLGRSEMEKENYEGAVAAFQKAREIDAGVAILNHLLGKCYLHLDDSVTGRRHLREAIDQDGFYSRSITPLHAKAKALAGRYPRLHCVDSVAAFHAAMEGDVTDHDLFTDICHPSFLGHVIIGHTFLDELVKLEPFRSWKTAGPPATGPKDWHALGEKYYEDLNVEPVAEADQIFSHILWYFNMAEWTAYRADCYAAIDDLIAELETKAGGSVPHDIGALVSRARLAVVREKKEDAVKALNEAFRMSPMYFRQMLSIPGWNRYIWQEFDDAGITYDSRQDAFVWPDDGQ